MASVTEMCHFLDLPTEIRLMIYDNFIQSTSAGAHHGCYALLQTCQQLFVEAEPEYMQYFHARSQKLEATLQANSKNRSHAPSILGDELWQYMEDWHIYAELDRHRTMVRQFKNMTSAVKKFGMESRGQKTAD